MGQRYRKIKYESQGGQFGDETIHGFIYVHFNDTAGWISVYDRDGRKLITELGDGGNTFFNQLEKIMKDRDDPECEMLTEEDFKMLKDKNGGYIA